MRKLKLSLEALAVEAFVATPAVEGADGGTVHGRAVSGTPECPASPRCEDTPLASCDSCEARCQPATDGYDFPA